MDLYLSTYRTITYCILFLAYGIATITDAKDSRIPNWLTSPLMIVGGVYYLIQPQNLIFVFLVFIFLCFGRAAGMKAGDLKLLIGSMLIDAKLTIFAYVVGNVYALIYLLIRYIIQSRIKKEKENLKLYFAQMAPFFMMAAVLYVNIP